MVINGEGLIILARSVASFDLIIIGTDFIKFE
jgi:hypothetical protein